MIVKRLVLVGNKRTHGDNLIMAIDHMEMDLKGGLITRSDDRAPTASLSG